MFNMQNALTYHEPHTVLTNMARSTISRALAVSLSLAVLTLAAPAEAQQLPPGITIEQFNKLTPQEKAELLRRLQQAGVTAPQDTLRRAQMQLPESLIPQVSPELGVILARVDTTRFFVETPYDFGEAPGELGTGEDLELFGRRIFTLAPEAFTQSTYGPVGPDYRLGPGDELVIQMWGAYQRVHELYITREGYILIPEVGQIVMASLTLEQAKRYLLQFMTPSYQALDYGRSGATAFLDVSLGELRALRVFVMGDALTAGAYTLSSVSTIFTALYAAGGPSVRGSLRDIALIRGSREITRLDGYDYLVRGDPSDDKRLEDGDIVFIPPIGPKVAVQGRVKREAVYELKAGETLKDAIAAAGGVTASALLERAQIARILPPEERGETPYVRVFIDVNLEQILSDDDIKFPLFDGDVVTVFPVPDDSRGFVVVEGVVWNPGRLQWREGLSLREAILKAGGLREEALMSRVNVIRTHPDETTEQISTVLSEAMSGDPRNNTLLERRDRVEVLSIHDVYPSPHVFIYGQVQTPGQYLLHDNMTLLDLIVRAGGLNTDAWTEWAELVRVRLARDGSVTEFTTQMVPIDTTYAPAGPGSLILQDLDQVFVRRKPLWEVRRNVELRGEVMFPGAYSLQRDDETVVELVRRAGGLSPYANASGARFYRQREDAGRINIDLNRALENPTLLDNIIMQPGDSLYVPPIVDYVTVQGAVGFPTSVLYVRGKGLKYYITNAGGYAENADKIRTRVIFPNGSIWQSRGFLSARPRIEPGSNIFVPVSTDVKKDAWETIRDTTALLTSFTTVLLLIWQISK